MSSPEGPVTAAPTSGRSAIVSLADPATLLLGAAAAAVLASLALLSLYDYLLFHSIVEFAGIGVGLAIFIIVWNTRRNITDPFIVLIGIAFLFISIMDLIHTLAYKGMGVFPGNSADLPTQLWIAARYFQSIAFLFAALLIGKSLRKFDAGIFLALCGGVTTLLLASIFVFRNFPHAFVEDYGLTVFKIGSEYFISLLMLATIAVLVRKRRSFDPAVWNYLVWAQVFLIAGELAFTSYVSVYGFMNMTGHLLRLISVYFFYRAIVVVSIARPYDILFRELKEREQAVSESNRTLEAILTAAKESISLFDVRGRTLMMNPTALERLGGLREADVIGRPLSDYMPPEIVRQRMLRADRVVEEKSPVSFEDTRNGIVFDHSLFPLFDSTGTVDRIAVFSRDVTARKNAEQEVLRRNEDLQRTNEALMAAQAGLVSANDRLSTALREKEILLAEVHHRVKNNLASFISLVDLGMGSDETPAGTALKNDLRNRAQSMALIHEILYRTNTFSTVDMGIYLTSLARQIAETYRLSPVAVIVDADGVTLDLARATPCGLIVNEILTNSFKYAFPPGFDCQAARKEPCTIRLAFGVHGGEYRLRVSDNGTGLPPGTDPASGKSLGLRLIHFLARHQLHATVDVTTGKGTSYCIRFPAGSEGASG